LRFFRKSKVKWGGAEPHEKPIPQGPVKELPGEIFHFTYDDLGAQFNQLLRFAYIAAEQEFEKGRKTRVRHLPLNPFIRFFRFYFLKQGFREGVAGLIVALAEAGYTFVKYARLWELNFNASDENCQKDDS
jgi:hypothetical protein